MTETSKATCATCQWWTKEGSRNEEWAECRHVSQMDADADPPTRSSEFYCNEHSELAFQRERLRIASEQMAAMMADRETREAIDRVAGEGKSFAAILAESALWYADVLLAEAKRRRGE